MLKKLLFVFSLIAATAANGQTAVKTSGVFDNVYVNGHVGTSTNLHFNPVFPINTSVGGSLGKWLNPKTGVELTGNLVFGSADYQGGRWSYKNAIRGLYVGANIVNDIPNLFVQKNRTFTVQSRVGLGWLHSFNNGSDDNDLAARTGLAFIWNVSKAFNLYAEPAIYWNLTSNNTTPKFNSAHAQFAVEVGFVYNFKNHDGSRGFTYYNIGAMNDSINAMRKLANEKEAENKELQKKLTETNEVHDTIYINMPVQNFSKGSSKLVNKEALDVIKAGTEVSVYGYASPEGSTEFNQKLSEKRAKAVADYLTSKGVVVKEVKGFGESSNGNRIVIIKK